MHFVTEYSEQDLSRFRHSQQLAYRCVEAVHGELRAGMTEKQAARMMRSWLSDRGCTEYFHVPFAWFGDRTSFTGFKGGFRSRFAFQPSGRRLVEGMPVILDVAPAPDGYAADIGYSCCLGENPDLDRMLDDLAAYRTRILELVKQGKTARQVYLAVDELAIAQGYANRHSIYPYRVLAHRVFRLEPGLLDRVVISGFGIRAARGLDRMARAAVRGVQHQWPLWNDAPESDVPIGPGLWAVEPHLGVGPIGGKWEEMLVVTEHDAYWLDDDLPHVRRWKKRSVPIAA